MSFDEWKKPREEVVKYFTNVFDVANHKTETELKQLFMAEPTVENIEKRVNRLSAVYGTRIRMSDQEAIARFIFREGIVADAVTGKDGVVERIGLNENEGYNHCLSFASKFCSFCNPDVYPIYDSIVLEVLLRLNDKYKFDSNYTERERNRIKSHYDYARFCKIIEGFRHFEDFGLDNCSLREIDKFLWIAGKGLVD